ncbi:MAG: hypothetical protein ACE37K_18580 [Planctomycetota bacterium]
MSTLRLILWPSLITALVSTARLVAEINEWVPPRSGGALHPLGISWLAIVFGAWFGMQLRREGSTPRIWPAWPWSLIGFAAIVASVGWQFGPLLEADQSEETFAKLRVAVLTLAGIASTLMVGMFVLWPRLALTMLCYAIPARALVVVFTLLAKQMEWDTHYTRFGPTGIERDLPSTMLSTAIAQGGFWVPWTVTAGFLLGAMFGRKRQPTGSHS